MTTAELVGANIRRLRQARGLKQEALAAMCGDAAQGSSSISRIERGQSAVDVTTLGRIAAALEVTLAELCGGEPVGSERACTAFCRPTGARRRGGSSTPTGRDDGRAPWRTSATIAARSPKS